MKSSLNSFLFYLIGFVVACVSCAEDPLNSEEITYLSLNLSKTPESNIDINGDGVPEFRLSVVKDSILGPSRDVLYVEVIGFKQNAVLTDLQSFTNDTMSLKPFVKALPDRTLIGPSADTWENNSIISYQGFFNGSNVQKGILSASSPAYIGVAFDIETKLHYGWIQIENQKIREFELIDAAFHQKPNIALQVGSQ